jgi:glycosyltransferase involved in cell wall biosynthesis
MRFHVLSVPHTISSKTFNACAYTQKAVKFCKMMTQRGHEVIHYGHEHSEVICSEHVSVLSNQDFETSYGDHDARKKFYKFNLQDHAYQVFYKNSINEIQKRKQKNDFLLAFWGWGVKEICDAHKDMIVVEPGIGYADGSFAPWRIFESYAIYHVCGGSTSVTNCQQNNYHIVIPNYFDLEDFDFCNEKEDYFLYLGRVYEGKGVHVAIEACQKTNSKLIIAGQKENFEIPQKENIEYVGYADIEKRKKLMSKAKAVLMPSQYVEPFGGVQIESLLCGTPTITSDWGAFTENNIHGITGFRCRTMGDYINAINKIHTIDPKACRKWAENFSLEKIAPMYEKYFIDVYNVYNGAGWYEATPEFFLNANKKDYPATYNSNLISNTVDEIIEKLTKIKT